VATEHRVDVPAGAVVQVCVVAGERGIHCLRSVPTGGVIVLIGLDTSSSAQLHAVDLEAKLGAVLTGEPIGRKPNAYGEVRWLVLRSWITVRY